MYVAMGIAVFHSTGKLGKTICFFTVGLWRILRRPWKAKQIWNGCATHIATWFRAVDGSVVYFEALEGKGFKGPFPMKRARDWADKKKGRWVKEYELTEDLGMTRSEIDARYWYAESRLKIWDYSTPQLLIQPRIAGIARTMIPASVDDVICSEAGSRLCNSPVFSFPERCGKKQHDGLNPEDISRECERIYSRRR